MKYWEEKQVAFSPGNDDDIIFSGSIVIDHNNTSEFFDEFIDEDQRFVAIYTKDRNLKYKTLLILWMEEKAAKFEKKSSNRCKFYSISWPEGFQAKNKSMDYDCSEVSRI